MSLTAAAVSRVSKGTVALGHGSEHRSFGDASELQPGLQRGDRAARRMGGAGEDDELVGVAALAGLGSGELQVETAVVVGDVVDVDADALGAAQRGDEPDEE